MAEFEERYGDPDVIARTYIKKAIEWPTIKNGAKELDSLNKPPSKRLCKINIIAKLT